MRLRPCDRVVGKAIEPYGLFWGSGRPWYRLNATLAEHYAWPLARGENLFSAIDGKNLLRYGGLRSDRDWVQVDPARPTASPSGVFSMWPARRAGRRRRLIPHGGHQLALNIAAGLQLGGSESYPGVFQPYRGFADTIPVVDGYAPGVA